MYILLSPSKTQNFTKASFLLPATQPIFKKEILDLTSDLKKLSKAQIKNLMSISDNLADLNFTRFQTFEPSFTQKNSKPALFAFEGDVYTDIEAQDYSKSQLEFANNHIRILSGLYGLLKPMDLIQPYRLEMKTKLKTAKSKNLYEFWGSKISQQLNDADYIINLASEEYFKAVDLNTLKAPIINVHFKQKKGSDYKIIPIYAKKARGTMANFIVKNKITKPTKIQEFEEDNYKFASKYSTPTELVFVRG
jgi:cytoplasmic iron level regulating protein YaaA (DUF328/UPF0246 family)